MDLKRGVILIKYANEVLQKYSENFRNADSAEMHQLELDLDIALTRLDLLLMKRNLTKT